MLNPKKYKTPVVNPQLVFLNTLNPDNSNGIKDTKNKILNTNENILIKSPSDISLAKDIIVSF